MPESPTRRLQSIDPNQLAKTYLRLGFVGEYFKGNFEVSGEPPVLKFTLPPRVQLDTMVRTIAEDTGHQVAENAFTLKEGKQQETATSWTIPLSAIFASPKIKDWGKNMTDRADVKSSTIRQQ